MCSSDFLVSPLFFCQNCESSNISLFYRRKGDGKRLFIMLLKWHKRARSEPVTVQVLLHWKSLAIHRHLTSFPLSPSPFLNFSHDHLYLLSPIRDQRTQHRAMTTTPTAKPARTEPPDASPAKKSNPPPPDSVASMDTVDVTRLETPTATTMASSGAGTESMTTKGKTEKKEADPVIDTTPLNGSGTDLGTGLGNGPGTGDSSGNGSGEAGGFSVGGESVVLWEESSVEAPPPPPRGGKESANGGSRLGGENYEGSSRLLILDIPGGGAASGTIADLTGLSSVEGSIAPADPSTDTEEKSGGNIQEEMPQEDTLVPTSAAVTKQEAGVAGDPADSAAAAAAGIPLAGKIAGVDESAAEGEAGNAEITADAALAAEARAGNPDLGKSADEARETVKAAATAAVGGGEGGAPVVPPVTVSAGVVGWASGLFRCAPMSFCGGGLQEVSVFVFFAIHFYVHVWLVAGVMKRSREVVFVVVQHEDIFPAVS